MTGRLIALAGLCTALVASALAQTPSNPSRDKPQQPEKNAQDKNANPLTNSPDGIAAPLQSSGPLKDYRIDQEAIGQRAFKAGDELAVFGYSYFDPARQIIEARRAYLKRQYSDQEPAGNAVPTREDVESVNKLTDSQKLDLLLRQRQAKLTDEEKVKYRTFLFPESPRADTTEVRQAPANSFRQIADPYSLVYQNVNASVPTNYQISAGDSLNLRLSSPTMALKEMAVDVDSFGGVTVPEVGHLIIRGQTAAQAEQQLRQAARRIYRDAEVSLSLHELRTIPVTVSGDSFAPGTYVVPAVATLYNILYATGGPNQNGTLRKIELRRRGAVITRIDFYRFLITGDSASDLTLQPGDVIYIPPKEKRVYLRGEVARPSVYELLPAEVLKDALGYCGGIKATGVAQRVQVSTLQPGQARMLRDVDATDPGLATAQVYDGDSIDVFSVRPILTNVVTIEGAVDQPAQYGMTPNMTVADLVQRARGLLSEAYPTRADIFRVNADLTLTRLQVNLERALARDPADNMPLTRWDRLKVYTRQEVQWQGRREVTVRGAVHREGIFNRSDNMRVRDLLIDAGGTLPEAYMERATLMHQKPDGTFAYDFVSLNEALKDNPEHNRAIQDRDILAVYRYDQAKFFPEHSVSIQGAIVSPGKYPRAEKMRLSDLLTLSGGLTPAAGDRIVVAHSRVGETEAPVNTTYSFATSTPSPDPELKDGDIVTIQGLGTYRDRPSTVIVTGAVNRVGPIVLKGPNMRLSEVVKEAGGLKNNAFAEGTEFYRNPETLESGGQKQAADFINRLNDLLNQSQYKRELAKSDLEHIRVFGAFQKSQAPASILGGTAGSSPTPSPADLLQMQMDRALVSQPRALSVSEMQPTGNVAVNLPGALAKPGNGDDFVVMDGDRINIPERPTTVQVVGAVFIPQGVMYREGASPDYYIQRSGGFTQDAARDRIRVLRLGGGILTYRSNMTLRAGDVILVPTKVLADRMHNRGSDVDNLFRNITSSAILYRLAVSIFGL